MRLKIISLLSLMAFDIISGFIKVKINREKFESSKMATGLYKKTGTILCLSTVYILEQNFAELHGVNLFYYTWLYTMVMESVSIFENCSKGKMKEFLLKGVKNIDSK